MVLMPPEMTEAEWLQGMAASLTWAELVPQLKPSVGVVRGPATSEQKNLALSVI